MLRWIRLNFRQADANATTWHCYTSVRVPGKPHPRQVRLGTVSDGPAIGNSIRARIQRVAERELRRCLNDAALDVAVRWDDAVTKWQRRSPRT